MGRTMPTECEHGHVVDWGDFGEPRKAGMLNGGALPCPECEANRVPTLSPAVVRAVIAYGEKRRNAIRSTRFYRSVAECGNAEVVRRAYEEMQTAIDAASTALLAFHAALDDTALLAEETTNERESSHGS